MKLPSSIRQDSRKEMQPIVYFPFLLHLSTQLSTSKRSKKFTYNLENCPRIAGTEPLYNPLAPISGSFAMISGNESVEACTRVCQTNIPV